MFDGKYKRTLFPGIINVEREEENKNYELWFWRYAHVLASSWQWGIDPPILLTPSCHIWPSSLWSIGRPRNRWSSGGPRQPEWSRPRPARSHLYWRARSARCTRTRWRTRCSWTWTVAASYLWNFSFLFFSCLRQSPHIVSSRQK